MLGQVDLRHSAGADAPFEAILAQLPGLGDLPAQPEDRAGPVGRADGQDREDQRVEGEQEGPRGLAIEPTLPEPLHRRRVLQRQYREGRERQQRQRPGHQRGAAPGLGDVEPVGKDQDGGQQHGILQNHRRRHHVATLREPQHQPVFDEGDAAGKQADRPQLQGLERGQRDRAPAPEQGDEPHQGQDDRPIHTSDRRVLPTEDAATPERRGRQDEDIDDRQLAQSCPHGVRELGDRLLLLLRRDRRPGSQAPALVGRCVPGPSGRLRPLRGGFDAGGPACRPIRGRTRRLGRRQKPAPVHPLVLGQAPANLRPQLIVPSAGGAQPGLPPGGVDPDRSLEQLADLSPAPPASSVRLPDDSLRKTDEGIRRHFPRDLLGKQAPRPLRPRAIGPVMLTAHGGYDDARFRVVERGDGQHTDGGGPDPAGLGSVVRPGASPIDRAGARRRKRPASDSGRYWMDE